MQNNKPEEQQTPVDENTQAADNTIDQQASGEPDAATSQSEESTVVNKSQVDDETGCNCEFCESCSFFIERLSVLPELAKQVREHYCYQYKFRCARYVLKQLTGKGDPNLLPSDIKTVAERLGWDL